MALLKSHGLSTKLFSSSFSIVKAVARRSFELTQQFGSFATGAAIVSRGNQSRRSFEVNSTRKMMSSKSSYGQGSGVNDLVAPKDEVVRFISDCMKSAGTTEEDAITVAHHLMTADYRGHQSHGMNRMQMYVNDIKSRITDPAAKPEILTDFQAIALVDGKNALGQVVGKYCMELAMEKARNFGIGMVTARGSNHYGICGYYTLMAMENDLIGFSCTNTSPLMAPTRSKAAALGTNPLSLGMAAAETSDDFVLDMATTAVALGKIELAIRKEQDIPSGWALGKDGKPTKNAEEAFQTGLLMPLGGAEENSGYKGYGLALMVEILTGILTGSNFGPNIRSWKAGTGVANLGQCFIVINPEAFGTGSKERLSHLVHQLRNLPTAGKDAVLIAGDPERAAMKKVDDNGGISYHQNQINSCIDVAKELGVEPMNLIKKTT